MSNPIFNYILKDKIPVPCEDLLEWGKWFQDPTHRRVAETVLSNGTCISTVFLGTDHNFFAQGPPLLFETMVFPLASSLGLDMNRYSTWEEAEKGHEEMVKKWSKE